MDPLIDFLVAMPFWVWFVIAALFLVGELTTGTSYLLWPAAAATLVGLISIGQLEGRWVTQWGLFAVLTVGLGVVGRPYAERFVNTGLTDRPGLNRRGHLVGKQGTAIADFVAGRGRVRLGDTDWSARVPGEAPLAEGATVRVVALEGTTLIVSAV